MENDHWVPCYCAHCATEGALPQDRTCRYWQECNPEGGHHGDACECVAPDGEEW